MILSMSRRLSLDRFGRPRGARARSRRRRPPPMLPPPPQRFGAAVKVKTPSTSRSSPPPPRSSRASTIRLEGTVKDVCQGRGCWVEVTDDKGASFMARSLDESVLLPKDCKGMARRGRGQGDDAARQGRHEPAPTDHACPKPEYVVSTRGVELTPAPAGLGTRTWGGAAATARPSLISANRRSTTTNPRGTARCPADPQIRPLTAGPRTGGRSARFPK